MWSKAFISCFNFLNVYLVIAKLVISKKANGKVIGSQLIGSNGKE